MRRAALALTASALLAGAVVAVLQAWSGGPRSAVEPRASTKPAHAVSPVIRLRPDAARPARSIARALPMVAAPGRRPLGSVLCRLTDTLGAPIDTATLVLRHGARIDQRTALRPGGSVRFTGLVAGRYSVTVEPGSLPVGWLAVPYATTATPGTPFELERGEDTHVDLVATRAAVVHGYVTDRDGHPAVGAVVRLQSTSRDDPSDAGPAVTDQHGYYDLRGLLPGTYRAQLVLHERHGTAPAPRLQVLDAGRSHTLDFSATADSRTVVGRLVDHDGRPATGVSVHAEVSAPDGPETSRFAWSRVVARTTTDANGEFELERLPPARVRVRAAARRAATRGFSSSRSEYIEATLAHVDLATRADTIELDPIALQRVQQEIPAGNRRLSGAGARHDETR